MAEHYGTRAKDKVKTAITGLYLCVGGSFQDSHSFAFTLLEFK